MDNMGNTVTPNVILIFADDLERGMLSCYGQQHFETPMFKPIYRKLSKL